MAGHFFASNIVGFLLKLYRTIGMAGNITSAGWRWWPAVMILAPTLDARSRTAIKGSF
jgi:hypothetical protein